MSDRDTAFKDGVVKYLDSFALPLSATTGCPLLVSRALVIGFCITVLLLVQRWIVQYSVGGSKSSLASRLHKRGVVLTTSKNDPPNVVLLGPSASGKTALFYMLALDEAAVTPTVPSLTKNEETIKLKKLSSSESGSPADGSVMVRLVDYPGHHRLRPGALKLITQVAARTAQYAEQQAATSRYSGSKLNMGVGGILFVLDANDRSSVKQASELLYDILCDPLVSDLVLEGNGPRLSKTEGDDDDEDETDEGCGGDDDEDDCGDFRIRVCIVCNKSDLTDARSCRDLKRHLERDIELLHRARSVALDGQEVSACISVAALGGAAKKDTAHFSFSTSPIRATFVRSSAVRNDIDGVRRFIGRVGRDVKK